MSVGVGTFVVVQNKGGAGEACLDKAPPLTGRFLEKWPERLARVGAGEERMWGVGPCGRPLLGHACSSEEKTYPCEVLQGPSGLHACRASGERSQPHAL